MSEASDMITSLVEMYELSVGRGRRANGVLASTRARSKRFHVEHTKNL